MEDTKHFLQDCPALSAQRSRMRSILSARLSDAGVPGAFLLKQFELGGAPQLELLLGSTVVFPACHDDTMASRYAEQCAMALWIADKNCKNYFCAIWRRRASIVGELRIVGNTLVRVPPAKPSHPQEATAEAALVHCQPGRFRSFWEPWLRHVVLEGQEDPQTSRRRMRLKRGKRNFFRVWRGHSTGIFYKWSDCLSSIRGFHDPGFKGFNTLKGAQDFVPPRTRARAIGPGVPVIVP